MSQRGSCEIIQNCKMLEPIMIALDKITLYKYACIAKIVLYSINYIWFYTAGSICSPGQFRCRNRNCTYSFHVCDLHDDCGDSSDELYCEEHKCADWEFKCKNHKCIPKGMILLVTSDKTKFYKRYKHQYMLYASLITLTSHTICVIYMCCWPSLCWCLLH